MGVMLEKQDKTRKTIYGATAFAGLVATIWFGVEQEQVDTIVPVASSLIATLVSLLAFRNTPSSTGKHAKPE